MPKLTTLRPLSRPALRWTSTVLAAAALAACGGGSGGNEPPAPELTALQGAVALQVQLDAAEPAPEVAVLPVFHVAPVLLDEPDGLEATDPDAAVRRGPHVQRVPAQTAGLSSRALTLDRIEAEMQRPRALGAGANANANADGSARPLADSSSVSVYSPAQIRAAYGLPALPAAGATLSATQAAQLGAGQTIYIVNAKHNPNVAAELSAFNARFGLPTCSVTPLAANARLPLAAASAKGCELVVAYTTGAAALSDKAPAYDSGWATEIALDVQWAHATAPLARLVLIEAPDASASSLGNAVRLANAMGPGVVSMSFGAAEGNWTASYDSAFASPGMSYLAATGDNGVGVSWPAVANTVLAVGGTTLRYSGSGARSETAWKGSGGGVSAFVNRPAYQGSTLVGSARRAVADVAFNADAGSGQYVAVIAPGATAPKWISAGGTSMSAPQWAGLLAVANALRVQAGKALLGAPHGVLYGQIATVPGTYAATFADISQGSNGSCSLCSARTGYDIATGWGTPNALALWANLSGSAASAPAPAPAPAPKPAPAPAPAPTPAPAPAGPSFTANALSGVVGKALTGSISFSAPGAQSLNLQISGAPAGMSFAANSSSLSVSWPKPLLGSYTLTVMLKDNLGRSGSASIPVSIAAK